MSRPAAVLAKSLSRYALDVHGRTPRRVQVVFTFGDDNKSHLTIPEHDLVQQEAGNDSPDHDELCLTDQAIIETLKEAASGEKLTGEDLAGKAGYSFNSRFRERLAFLAKFGRIQSSRNGYFLPENK